MEFLNKYKMLIAIILVAIIVATAAIVTVVVVTNQPKPQTPHGGVVFDPNQGDAGDDPANTAPQVPNVAIPGWQSLTLPPNTEEITVDFFNPEQNAGYYYMTFELRLINPDMPEGYEVLYKSGNVEAGKHIKKIKLTRGLPEGEYAAFIHVQPYFLESGAPTNNANTSIKLIVK